MPELHGNMDFLFLYFPVSPPEAILLHTVKENFLAKLVGKRGKDNTVVGALIELV